MILNIYFDLCKKVLDIKSESELARRLKMTPQELYRARKEGWCRDDVLLEVEKVTGNPLEDLVVAREAHKSKPGAIQHAWIQAYEKVIYSKDELVNAAKEHIGQLHALIVAILLMTSGFLPANDALAYPTPATQVIDSANKDYRKYLNLYCNQVLESIGRLLSVLYFRYCP